MSSYISRLNASVAAEACLRAEQRELAKQAVRERLSPLEDRLRRLLATIPVEVQREGLSLAELQKSLRGRWRGNCHPGELGAALRKLGLTRRRVWRDGTGFRALWHSPIHLS